MESTNNPATMEPVLPLDRGSETGSAGTLGGTPQAPSFSDPTPGTFYLFSPETCLELVPQLSSAQTSREAKYLRALIPGSVTSKSGSPYVRTDYIKKAISESLQLSVETTNPSFSFDPLPELPPLDSSLTNQTLPDLRSEIDRLKEITESLKLRTPGPVLTPPHLLDPLPKDEVILEEPVSLSQLDVEFTVHELINELKAAGIKFKRRRNRLIVHFGEAYSYGSEHHPKTEYPNSPIITSIMKDLDLDQSEWNLLITLYPNGKSYIPPHSDNERCIIKGTDIITLSLGASRTILFNNLIGPLQPQSHILDHGTIFTMTQSSQAQWEHSIPSDPTCTQPRISLTFRRITPLTEVPKPRLPPIAQSTTSDSPLISKSQTPSGPKKRVLFLTDSNNISLPTHHFPSHYTVVKKPLMQTTHITEYEREFSYTDIVIIASGINDLSRHGYTGLSLFNSFLGPKLREYCQAFPDTDFIYSSLLPVSTKLSWLNYERNTLNRLLFELSLELKSTSYNLFFMDVADLMHPTQSLKQFGNGIHISLDAQKLFTRTLRACIEMFLSPLAKPSHTWPLRSYFRDMLTLG